MAKTNTLEQIKISPYAKIKVYWDDSPENYSKENKIRIRNSVAKKYGVNKNNIDVIYRPVKLNGAGELIEITGANIENILDITYQRELMKEYIKRENKIVDFDRIVKLDNKVNAELNLENNPQQRFWSIKWLTINNFLSFGVGNIVPFDKIKGLTVINSLPENQGGKTTLAIDALMFLLYGSTTKTDKNEEIFNQYTDSNELLVRGLIEIGSEELIIERKMSRSAKKAGGWNITNKVNYYEILPDGEEKLKNEEDAKKTTTLLKKTIGTKEDFEMLVLATERNLDDLIGLTTTESGKVLTRLIGLEVIEMKETIVRKMFNDFEKKKKSNDYDVVTLTSEIEEHIENNQRNDILQETLTDKYEKTKQEIISLNEENDKLLGSKVRVDVKIVTLNPTTLETEIQTLTSNGVNLKIKKEELEVKINNMGPLKFEEDLHHKLTADQNSTVSAIQIKKSDVTRLKQNIKTLVEGGICQACNRKLDDVDNSEHINKHTLSIEVLNGEIDKLSTNLELIKSELVSLNEIKTLIDTKNKLELDRDRVEVEMGSLRNKITSKRDDLKEYKLNQTAIDLNKRIDSEVSMVKTKLIVADRAKDELYGKLEKVKLDIITNKDEVEKKKKLIEQIKKEDEVEKIYKIYIELVGKKGIAKLVLRSVLPIINSEVQRLLDEVTDFEIEIFIDDKNDVQFLIIKDGVSKLLKSGSGFEKTASSLALRSVLGKLSTLPMPNFIAFDEVLGKVASINVEKLKPLFDKIKNMYEIVFLITHNDLVKDWGDNIITVLKENNISKITIK